MKVVGLTKPAFLALLPGVHPKLKFNETEAEVTVGGKPTFQGWLSYKGYASNGVEGYVHKGSVAHSKPCGHVVAKVVCAALQAGASSVWAEKHKFHSGYKALPNAVAAKVKVALSQKKNETCVCGGAVSFIAPTKATTAPTVPAFAGPAVPEEPTEAFDAQALDGDALLDGTGDASVFAKGQAREVMASVTGLYVLQEVATALRETVRAEAERKFAATHCEVYKNLAAAPLLDAAKLLWPDRWTALQGFETFKADYERTIARNLFDYLTVACVGEMRHTTSITWTGMTRPQSRTEAYTKALAFDPRTILPMMHKGFTKVHWSSAYGGKKWGKIAESAALFFKFAKFPVVFADHVVDLSHNGGVAFNKGYLMHLKHSDSEYLAMLDRKRNGSLLGWTGHTLHVETALWAMVVPVLDLLAPRYEYRTDADACAAYDAWDARCPTDDSREYIGKPAAFAAWRAEYRAWADTGKALGFAPGIPPSATQVKVSGLTVTASIATTEGKSIPALKWGTEAFTLKVKKGHAKNEPEESEASEAEPTTVETYHAARPGQIATGTGPWSSHAA